MSVMAPREQDNAGVRRSTSAAARTDSPGLVSRDRCSQLESGTARVCSVLPTRFERLCELVRLQAVLMPAVTMVTASGGQHSLEQCCNVCQQEVNQPSVISLCCIYHQICDIFSFTARFICFGFTFRHFVPDFGLNTVCTTV